MPTYEQCVELTNNAPAFISPEPPSFIDAPQARYGFRNPSPLPPPTNFSVLPLGRTRFMLYWQESAYPQGGWNTAARQKYVVTLTYNYASGNDTRYRGWKWTKTFPGRHEFVCSGDCSCSVSPVREYAQGYFYCILDLIDEWVTLPTHGTFSLTLQSVVTAKMPWKNIGSTSPVYAQLTSSAATATTVTYDFPFPVYDLKCSITPNPESPALLSWRGETVKGLTLTAYRVGLQNEDGSWSEIYTGPNTSITIPRLADRGQSVRVTALYLPQYNNGNLTALINNFPNYYPFGLIPSKAYIAGDKSYTWVPDKSADPIRPTIDSVVLNGTTSTTTSLFVRWSDARSVGLGTVGADAIRNVNIVQFRGCYIEYGISNNPSSWTRLPTAFFGQSARLILPVRSTQGISLRMQAKSSLYGFSTYTASYFIPTP